MVSQVQTSNAYVQIGPSSISNDWQIGGAGDFDRDGNVDILWRQTSTGQVGIWRLNGLQLQTVDPFVLIAASPAGDDWQMGGTGDFDHDDNLDILWRQTSSGDVWLWRLFGTQLRATNPFVFVANSPPGSDW